MDALGIIFVWCAIGAAIGILADSRGRSGIGFFLLSVVFSPLVGLIAVLVTKDLKQEAAKELQRRQEDEAKADERAREHEKQLESLRAITTTTGGHAAPAASVADELIKLSSLRDSGVLTLAEFDAQKQALLRRA